MQNKANKTTSIFKAASVVAPLPLCAAISVALVCVTAQAATIQVSTAGDPGTASTCTLRQAVASINAASLSGSGCSSTGAFGTADTINFAPGIVTISLGDTANNSVNITSASDLTIQGTGTGGVTIERPSAAINKFGVIRESCSQCTLTLGGLTISNGYELSAAGGGGIYSPANITMNYCVVSGNSTKNPASGTTHGGGISAATVTLSNSAVSGNHENGFGVGGGVFATNIVLTGTTISGNSAYGSGGGVYAKSAVTVSTSVISENNAENGAGILSPSVTLTGSTVSDNVASGYGGGISGVTTMTSSTVSGNSAKGGGGLNAYTANITNSTISGNTGVNYGGGILGTTVNMFNSTITNNSITMGVGAGMSLGYTEGVVHVSLVSSIISQNGSGAGTFDIATPRSLTPTGSNNMIGSASSTVVLTSLANSVAGNPLLAPLADNGGPTLTHALQPSSPAVHSGTNPQNLATDQRGSGFARETHGATDIGAFQVQDLIFANGFELP